MDGVGYISQRPFKAGTTFDYIFKATPAGTHWYHSHTGAQRTDGLFGSLVVREGRNVNVLQNVIDMPASHTLSLIDWQNDTTHRVKLREPAPAVFSEDGAELGTIPYWSGLINGKGRMTSTYVGSPKIKLVCISFFSSPDTFHISQIYILI